MTDSKAANSSASRLRRPGRRPASPSVTETANVSRPSGNTIAISFSAPPMRGLREKRLG
jgi:hypothetical protein